mmetsp:Transcript_15814/g.39299  ORF Transcript_15814/g.39299 Transcript_15814/m.39299 type:complete len:131 (+) Transcript_15814:778-1170(+)
MHPFPHFPVAFRILNTSLRYVSSAAKVEVLVFGFGFQCVTDTVTVVRRGSFRVVCRNVRTVRPILQFSSVVACCFGETLACKQAILCFNDMVAVAACFVHHLSQHHHIIASSHIHHSSIRTEDLPSHPTP